MRMSTVSTSRPAKRPPDEPDPFRYGWRYVTVPGPDGTTTVDQIPLTLEDVLFPETGDFIVQTDLHDTDTGYLKYVFKVRLSGDPDAVAISDCRVDWNLPGVRPLGPDVAVFFGIKKRRDWATLDVAAERARPALVVEVTSRSTRSNDLNIKPDYYFRAGVPLYVIADVLEETDDTRRLELIGYRRGPVGFERVAPNNRGWIWLDPLELWLGIVQDPEIGCDRLACFDAKTEEEIGDYSAVTAKAEAEAASRANAEQKAREAEQKAREAEQKAREAELIAQKAHQDAQAEIAARQSAEAEMVRAQARVRELEEALRRSGQGS
jgi:Uma2 family endonuclease